MVYSPRLSRLIRWLLAAVALVALAVVVAVTTFFVADHAARSKYYAAHPLIAAMWKSSSFSGERPEYRAVLLDRIPVGTDKARVLTTLVAEGFRCGENPNMSPAEGSVSCSFAEGPGLIYFMEVDWLIYLKFGDHRLLDCSALMLPNSI